MLCPLNRPLRPTVLRWCGWFNVAGAGGWLVIFICLSAAPTWGQVPPAPGMDPHAAAARMLGAASCAASSCHGNVTDPVSGPTYAAHRIWLKQDKHAQAFAALLEPRSENMIARLGSGWNLPAHREARCLKCHGHAETAQEPQAPSYDVADGVNCEVCHGPAEHWLRDHSRTAFWSLLSREEKAARGFRDIAGLEPRAELCVRCHVGDEDREVNHDLIAAGHPRLDFEYAAFSALMKKHWLVTDDHARAGGNGTDVASALDAELWRIGQTVSARQALVLTRARALRVRDASPNAPVPWPELTEYSCYACHHDLREKSVQQYGALALSGVRKADASQWDVDPPGTLIWQSWTLAQAPLIPGTPDELRIQLKSVREELRRPYPDPQRVVERCDLVLQNPAWQPGQPAIVTLEEVTALLDWATRDATQFTRDWDHAAQAYLTLTALIAARQQLAGPAVDPGATQRLRVQLQTMQQALRFPNQTNSPATYDLASVATLQTCVTQLRRELGFLDQAALPSNETIR